MGEEITAYPSYYTLPVNLEAEYIVIRTIEELEEKKITDKIAVLLALAGKKEKLLANLIQQQTEFSIIDNWVEGDHMLFVMQDISAVAFTSQEIFKLIDNVVHTKQDNLKLI